MEVKKKKVRVVMLPTNRATNILYSKKTNDYQYRSIPTLPFSNLDFISQHLYFISDDEIKVGDWYLVKQMGKLQLSTKPATKEDCKLQEKYKSYKVIATTNKSLGRDIESFKGECVTECLSKPSQSFIKKYCEKGGIDEVMVDYIPENYFIDINDSFGNEPLKPKVNKHNEISISSIKDSWSREEVIEAMAKIVTAYDNDYDSFLDAQKEAHDKGGSDYYDIAKVFLENL